MSGIMQFVRGLFKSKKTAAPLETAKIAEASRAAAAKTVKQFIRRLWSKSFHSPVVRRSRFARAKINSTTCRAVGGRRAAIRMAVWRDNSRWYRMTMQMDRAQLDAHAQQALKAGVDPDYVKDVVAAWPKTVNVTKACRMLRDATAARVFVS